MKTGEIIGPYRVVAKLGAGGMGEVYRARDPKLARDVAIEVLPELFAADPDRVARFEREVRRQYSHMTLLELSQNQAACRGRIGAIRHRP